MFKELEIEKWSRKDHFRFFSQFEEPFFGVTVQVDCTKAHAWSKKNGFSFFLFYLHCSLAAANQTEPFRYRIMGDRILLYDRIDASPTINRPDGTFGFSYMEYDADFEKFNLVAKEAIESVQKSTGLHPAISGENVIHFSSIPWLDFTSLSHARSFAFRDSCPKISFGKMTVHKRRKSMPVAIHVHHGLMDGIHVGEFMGKFQNLLNQE